MPIVREDNAVATEFCSIGYSYDDQTGAFDRVWWTVAAGHTATVQLVQGKSSDTFTLTGSGSQAVAGRKYTMSPDPAGGWGTDFSVTVWG